MQNSLNLEVNLQSNKNEKLCTNWCIHIAWGLAFFSFYLYIVPRVPDSLADMVIINQKIHHRQLPDSILTLPDVHCLYFKSTLWIIFIFSTRNIKASISTTITIKVWSNKALCSLSTQPYLQQSTYLYLWRCVLEYCCFKWDLKPNLDAVIGFKPVMSCELMAVILQVCCSCR